MSASGKSAPSAPTEEQVLSAMDPGGTTMRYGEIVTQLEIDTRQSRGQLYRDVDRILQRMKRAGRVELVKGAGGGWRKSSSERRVGAQVEARSGVDP